MAEQEIKEPELSKIRIYPENPKLPALANNLIIEIDGKKLAGVVEFTYKIDSRNIPIVDIKMIAETVIESHGTPEIRRLNPNQDTVKF